MSGISESVSEIAAAEKEERLAQKVELTVGDLQVFVNIIEATTQRGAFRAPELKGVGEFFEKISGLIPKDKSQ
jgi:hypothetical protein|tara:strand:+ start:287 stop:505 length:219 start_codon:yes stop_codon:yes gene_type:complete